MVEAFFEIPAAYQSRGEADDFEFGRRVDSRENPVHPKHRLVLQFRLTALAALKDGQSLENHDRGIADFERKIGYAALQ